MVCWMIFKDCGVQTGHDIQQRLAPPVGTPQSAVPGSYSVTCSCCCCRERRCQAASNHDRHTYFVVWYPAHLRHPCHILQNCNNCFKPGKFTMAAATLPQQQPIILTAARQPICEGVVVSLPMSCLCEWSPTQTVLMLLLGNIRSAAQLPDKCSR